MQCETIVHHLIANSWSETSLSSFSTSVWFKHFGEEKKSATFFSVQLSKQRKFDVWKQPNAISKWLIYSESLNPIYKFESENLQC